ncbi:alpha/beta hydrolase [Sandaracinobacteroides hominis]|uniref:alpha/beta hydrolase n=1 Tax=Sandaracinobacteroides hominis TaxID=2780086 RepID=UPI0018F561FC|nr:alpha/beta hydrolase [Sandaracinobacteroides hominis]
MGRRIGRWLGFLALVGVIVTILLSFHQPPMRLMPTPLAFRKSGSALFAANPYLRQDNRIELFYATNRLPVGPRNDRLYAVTPGRNLNLGVTTVRIGGAGTTWDKVYEWSMGLAQDERRPQLILEAMTELGVLDDAERPEDGPPLPAGMRAWLGLVDEAVARSPDHDIIIYVHGANSTVERAAGQAAQLRHFTGQNSVVLLFAWPTAENFLVYPRDIETAFGAAPQLARLVELLAAHTRVRRIDVLSYSAGGTVASDGLAQVGRWAKDTGRDPRLGEVYHAAPDADFRGFVDDLRDYKAVAGRVSVAVNMGDSALRLSEVVNRASRAGRPDMEELSPGQARFLLGASRDGLEVVRVRPENIPGLSPRSHGFWYTDPWVSSDVLLLLLFGLPPEQRGLERATADGGLTYWTFPPDYDARLETVLATARKTGAAPAP